MKMDLDVRTADGVSLAATLFPASGADGSKARGAVFLAGAMGVAQRFYAPLATWLAEQGFTVLTFDYRGMGRSLRGPLSKVDATVTTWAELDTPAALAALIEHAPGLPLTWLGHSLGGQIVPFVPEQPHRARVEKIVTVVSGSGYWKENAEAIRRTVPLFWWGIVPLSVRLFGYYPGARLGFVGDLPRGVIEEWRRWCLHPRYSVGVIPAMEQRYAEVKTPITGFSFTDDELLSRRNIESLHGFYTGAARTLHHLSPAYLGRKKVGHMGFFRREMEEVLWRNRLLPELAHV